MHHSLRELMVDQEISCINCRQVFTWMTDAQHDFRKQGHFYAYSRDTSKIGGYLIACRKNGF